MYVRFINPRRKQTTTIRHVAVRGIIGPQLMAPLKPLEYHGSLVPRGSRVAFDWSPIMPDAEAFPR